jgi:hypothetical protein
VITVLDTCDGGDAMLHVSALRIPLRRQSGRELAAGEGYRYLSELPWVPQAIASNRQLRWTAGDDSHADVETDSDGCRLRLRVSFDAGGDIVGGHADARPMDAGSSFIPTPWGGTLSDYATLGGMRIPTRAEAYCDLEHGRFVYWRGQVTSAIPPRDLVGDR